MTESHVKWSFDDRRKLSDAITPIVVGDAIFLLRDGGLLASLDVATGEVIQDDRVGEPDQYYASPVVAEGKIYIAGMGGIVSVVDAAGEWEVLATNDLEEPCVATPALDEGRIYIRTQSKLYCFGGG